MVKEVVCQVVADVAEDPSGEHGCRDVPVPVEHCVCELIEWYCKNDEKGWRHNEAVAVHGEVVVYAVEEEVGCDPYSVVG